VQFKITEFFTTNPEIQAYYKLKADISYRNTKNKARIRTTPHDTFKVGKLHQTMTTKASKLVWLLPVPVLTPEEYQHNLTSWITALRQCGCTKYSDDLIYSRKGTPRAMNNSDLDEIDEMSGNNINIYKEFKENVRNGMFPPLKVTNDPNFGFVVEACTDIPAKTLLIEYSGVVTKISEVSKLVELFGQQFKITTNHPPPPPPHPTPPHPTPPHPTPPHPTPPHPTPHTSRETQTATA